jgi:hypothetical protein
VELHHLTTAKGLAGAEAVGAIEPTWPTETSEAFPTRVVWLTSEPDPERQGWSGGAGRDPLTARITVDIHDAIPWEELKRRCPPEPVSGLETSARVWGGDPATWYVVERPVVRDEWVRVETFDPPPPPKPALPR